MQICSLKYKFQLRSVLMLQVALFFSHLSFCQKEANTWFFGNYAGITFDGKTVKSTTRGKLTTFEGCATISDKNGNLLFYTDGISVWDSSHNVTTNGTGLKGNSSSTQSAIIVPVPSNNNQFYIFTVDDVAGSDGLQYSLFDMTLNSGLGDVVSTIKNIKLIDPTCEKITAVQHANGKDYWVLTHKFNSDTILAYLVTAAGVNLRPVKSTTGYKISGNIVNSLGYMKTSPDGTKISYANYQADTACIGDFDATTGRVSNIWSYYMDDTYGIEFSTTSKYFYIAEFAKYQIFQFDAKAKTRTDFLSSKIKIDSVNRGAIGALQIGPDKKIYISRYGRAYLDVIHAPDSLGTACRLTYDDIDLLGRRCNFGLPTFIQSFFNPNFVFDGNCFGDTTWFAIADSSIADSVHWNFGDSASKSKNFAKGFRVFHLFSDTGIYKVRSISFRGSLRDTSLLKVTQKIYLGRFANLEKVVYKCFDDTITLQVKSGTEKRVRWSTGSDSIFSKVVDSGFVSIKKYYGSKCYLIDSTHVVFYKNNQINIPLSLGKDLYKCSYDSVKLSFYDTKSTKYTWSTGKSNTPIYVSKPANIWIKAFYGGSCYRSDTIAVGNHPSQKFTLGKDTFTCPKQSIMLGYFGEGYYAYLWGDNSTSPFLVTDTSGTYTLRIMDSSKCFKSDTIQVLLLNKPKINLGKDTSICNNTVGMILDAKNKSSLTKYKWGSGKISQTDTVKKTGKYWVRVTNACGTAIDTVQLKFINKPKALKFRDSIFCDKVSLLLDAANLNNDVKYLWNTKERTQSVLAKDSGIFKVVLSNLCGKDSSSLKITKYFTPLITKIKDTIFCKPFNLRLKIGKPNNLEAYNWNDLTFMLGLTGSDSVNINTPGMIEATIQNLCGDVRDTFLVVRLSSPKLKLDTLYEFCGMVKLRIGLKNTTNEELYLLNDSSISDSLKINSIGNYAVKSINNCGIDSASFRILVTQKPFIDLGNDTNYCQSVSRVLDAEIKDPKAKYQWLSGETSPSIFANTSGKYQVTVSNYCGIVKDSINLGFYKISTPDLGLDKVFCNTMPSITLTVKKANLIDKVVWFSGRNDTSELFNSPGKYWVNVNGPCGEVSDTVNFRISFSPKVDLGKDTSLCGNFQILLDAQNPGMQYYWSPSKEVTQIISANKQITYSVTVTNSDGCVGKDQMSILGNCISHYWFPNGFTPNDDLLNETFKPSIINFEAYEIKIFNRWGELLFISKDVLKGWDGTFMGNDCQTGVYFYISEFVTTENNQRQIVKGAIHLIR